MRGAWFIIVLSARNIRRRPQRSLVMAASCGFAILIAVAYAALTDGLTANTERNAVLMDSGLIQAHLPGYRDERDIYMLMRDTGRIERAAARLGLRVSFRLYGYALAADGGGNNSAGVLVRGFDPDREERVTRLSSRLHAGRWLAREGEAVVGAKLAARLGVGPGDEMVLVGQGADGSLANDLFTVCGVLMPVGADLDQAGVLVTDKSFRDFFVIGPGAHEAAFGGREMDRGELARTTAALARELPGLEVMSWRGLRPALARILDSSRASLFFMLAIIYAAMAVVVLNAVLMGVFERVGELGMMRAVGMGPFAVFFMVMAETGFLAASGGGCGLAVAWALVRYGETHPLDLSALAETGSSVAGVALDPLWYTRFDPVVMAQSFAALVAAALLAALWPAMRAAAMQPMTAMRCD